MTTDRRHGSGQMDSDGLDCGCCRPGRPAGISRRDFLKANGIALGAVAATGLAWRSVLAAAEAEAAAAPARQGLVVKPILTYSIPRRRRQRSWRNWGGIQTQEDADQEVARIQAELKKIGTAADFPVTFLPVSGARGPGDVEKAIAAAAADVIVVYAAGGWSNLFNPIAKSGKDVIFFVRHKSGPVYLWYEIVHPRYLRQHTDELAVKGIDYQDVVVDSTDELLWRLRALCGLKNALGTRIVAIGGPAGWGPGGRNAPEVARTKWKLDIRTVSYKELSKLINAAREDAGAVKTARERSAAYLKDASLKLETDKAFVEDAFLLEQVFRGLMAKCGARAITVNGCMGTILPVSKTTACLPLSTLNDAGYMAFCESDFVLIPSGILLSCISGRPQFFCNPTYPHGGVITLAHCTAPRRMDGEKLEPVRIVTHFESDYGAAPKVEMRKAQKLTMVIPDFAGARYVGLAGEIVDAPFLPICRSQIDVSYKISDERLTRNMAGFHWEVVYGDYLRETGYALRKIPIAWERLD